MSSAMPSPTPSTPRGRPSPPWMSSMLSNGRDAPSTDSGDKSSQPPPPPFIVTKALLRAAHLLIQRAID
ncbi:unnamed protein product [Staurois parvus]|uniref:Uncharacterized protein n=1 Tax=Staurois parvus TaxID=386267 RepID=A0ABN9HRM5_9NEOB|nr:unnamed protein product [Staurois parvus]